MAIGELRHRRGTSAAIALITPKSGELLISTDTWEVFVGDGVTAGGILIGGITQLTGDATAGPGAGSKVVTISSHAVTNAKLAQAAAHTLKGNNTGALADVTDLSVADVVAMLGLADTGITELTGDVIAGPGSGSQASAIAANAVTTSKINDSAVTNAKLADMAAHTFKANNTGGAAAPADITATQATAELNVVVGDSGAGGTKGLMPAPGVGDAAAGKYADAAGG